jgi:predicted TIM-barrel fold metal-dependent hydrolase
MTRDEQRAWLAQVTETIVDPDRPIVDPHHHLWRSVPGDALPPYLLEDLREDTDAGHRVVQTVFMECGAEYREGGPEHLRCVGETGFVADLARRSRESAGAEIAGIVGHVDLDDDAGRIGEALDAHEAAADGLFRGIRHGGAHDPTGTAGWLNATEDAELYARPDFRRAVALLGTRGLSYDTWHYHPQNAGFRDLAAAVPDTTLVLDHFGTPIRVGAWGDRQREVRSQWRREIAAIAECPNVVAKIGGLAMPPNGFGWHERATPPTSDEVLAEQREWYLHAIDCFGPERCMFESNFPVDKLSLSYVVYWNAMKKLAAEFSPAEQDALFTGTARRVYRLPDPD